MTVGSCFRAVRVAIPDIEEPASCGVNNGKGEVVPGGPTKCQSRTKLHQWKRTLHKAWSEHPERFVHGMPKPQPLPQEVWINPPAAASTDLPPKVVPPRVLVQAPPFGWGVVQEAEVG